MRYIRTIGLILIDIFIINFSYIFGMYLRFDGNLPREYLDRYLEFAIYITVFQIVVFIIMGLYKTLWRYASIEEFVRALGAVVISNLVVTAGMLIAINKDIPRSVYVIALVFESVLIPGIRLTSRAKYSFIDNKSSNKTNSRPKRTLVIGAGEAGVLVVKELNKHHEILNVPIGFIDDDINKKNRIIKGVPVLGTREDIEEIVKEYDIEEIIVALPSAQDNDTRDILQRCNRTKIKTKLIPGYYTVIDEKNFDLSKMREVQIEDLLGREEVHLDLDSLKDFIQGKVIMVTGAGGSIGSELCRQIIKFNPKKMVMVDIYENNIYNIQMELMRNYKNPPIEVLIDSIRDASRMDLIFDEYRPEIVFHAAAHKHVPLMEDSPVSAIKNNVFGTLNLLVCSDRYNVKKFVNISTDKAVNPTSVMGCTKRICEIMIQTMDKQSKTDFVAVRFGNVLGSNGSVIPLFKEQIKNGGPVTVTHPDIIRYFMTIPEACQLVLQAGAIAKGGEIFILDMGEPVRIVDLAEKLIELSGFVPNQDIKIEFTGLRPGEKLYEELILDLENSCKTDFEKIFIEKPVTHDKDRLNKGLDQLKNDLDSKDYLVLLEDLKYIVPNFTPERLEDNK